MRRIILSLVGALIVLTIIIYYGLLAWTYFNVRSLLEVYDAKEFAVNFNSENQQTTLLKTDSKGFFMPEGVVISPYFPYHRSLDGVSVTKSTCKQVVGEDTNVIAGESRYILIDRLWDVFWINIVPCGSPAKSFGPYRLK